MKFNTAVSVVGTILLNIAGSLCQLDVCGRAPLNNRIIGGENAKDGSWPWQVSIHNIMRGKHVCGGSLINKDWVLSAAHCFEGPMGDPRDIRIYLGRRSQSVPNLREIKMTVIKVIIHPNYDDSTFDNDIALLKLFSSVTFSIYIKPVCLAAAGSTFAAGTESWVTGWGLLQSNDAQISDILQEVMIPIVSNSDCDNAYKGRITSNMICAGLLNQGGKDACLYDSGGPMVSRNGSRWVQSSIVSFGGRCADPQTLGVYTRVSPYQDWINSTIGSNQSGFVKFSNGFRSSPNLLLFSSIPFICSLYLFS